MAFSDFLIRIGLDSSKFSQGSRRMGQDTSAVRQSIATLNATIGEQVRKMNEMVRAGQMGTKEFTQLNAAIRKNEGALRTLNRQLGDTGKKFGGLDMGQIGGALTGGLIGGGVAGAAMMGAQKLQQVFQDTLRVTVDFDNAIRKVGATSGASTSQMEDLRNAAIEMGSKTRFTASESAEALNYMALAGWNTEKSITALPGVLNLAAAAGTDLAMTSDILTDTMSAFGLEAKESSKVADVFAQVQSKANTTVEMLGEAMKYAAPQFAAAGQSIETTSTLIGLLANQGIKGTMAGTALNAMLKDMKTKAQDGTLAFGNMNIELYDQQGNFRNVLQIVGEMRKGMQGLTAQQRDAITGGLFEERSIKAINILLNSTDEVINNLSNDLLNASGRAKEMAGEMDGGVGGALTRMNSAWEGLQLTITGNAKFAQVWYEGWAAVFTSLTDDLKRYGRDIDIIARSFEIGFIDARNERRQLDAIERFSKAYKEAVEGMPTDKLTDQMTRLSNAAEFQALAFERRNAAAGKMLRPATVAAGADGEQINLNTIKGIEAYITLKKNERSEVQLNGKLYKELTAEIAKYEAMLKTTTGTTSGHASAVKTAATVYADLQKELASTEKYYQIINDEAQGLSEQHSMLQSAMKRAWQAGGKEAEQIILRIKQQLADMTTQRLVPEVAMLPSKPIGPVQSMTAGGLQLPQIDTTSAERIDAETAAMERQTLVAEELNNVYNQMGQSFGSMMESLASGSATAQEAFRAFAISALNAAQQFIQAQIAAAAAAQIKENSKFGLPGIALAGVAVAGLFGLLRGALSRSKSVKLAQGGIISGRTMAEVGEYPGAAFNPEVVAPLDKLQAMLDIGGSTHVTGTFRVQGSDLVLALDNAQRKMNQFRV